MQFVIIVMELKEDAKKGSKLKTISFSISSAMDCTEKCVGQCNACKQQISSGQSLLYL